MTTPPDVFFTGDYWDEEAARFKLPCSWRPASDLDFYQLLMTHIGPGRGDGRRSVLEVGCAPGQYLVFFGKRFGLDLYGLDRSAVGVEVTQKNISMFGLDGQIRVGDVLDDRLPEEMGTFDIVMSHGFIEHFPDTRRIMEKIFRYCRKGGLVITTVPNFNGLSGRITKVLAADVYHSHVRFSPVDLARVQQDLGGRVLFSGYTGHYQLRPPFRTKTGFRRRHPWLARAINFRFQLFNGVFLLIWPVARHILPRTRLLSKRITSICIKG